MKHIKLECKTRGFGYGDIIEVGTKKDISAEDAKSLVESGLAKVYTAPVTGGTDGKRVAELQEANDLLTAKVAELESIISAIGAGAVDGKDSNPTK